MSRTARVTGALLLLVVIVLIFAGWRLYDHSMRGQGPRSLGEQLIEALDQNSLPKANQLLDQGADMAAKEPYTGRTCLMAAATRSDEAIIRRMIQRGADINAMDVSRSTPLYYLLATGHPTLTLVKLLLPKADLMRHNFGSGTLALERAVEIRNPQIVRVLLDGGANAGGKGMAGKPLLIAAVEADDLATVRELVSHGASVNVPGQQGERALQTTLGLGDDAMAQYLIAHGADINVADADGNTPLLLAAANNLSGTLTALLAKGAKVNARNKKGETALIVAVRDGRGEMVDALLKAHADTTPRDKTTRSALAWAKDQDFAGIAQALKKHGAGR